MRGKIFLTKEIKYDCTDIIYNLECNKKNCTYKFATLKILRLLS